MNRQQLEEQARQAALKELQARRNAREHLIDFTTYTKCDYQVGAHHRLLCEKLEAVERGDLKRLMVFMPPRHGKSELASTRFPAWFLGRNPSKQIIAASYSAKLADKFGRDVRNIVSSQLYSNIFADVALASDSKAKDLWNTTKGGVFLSAGVGGSMTGYGGDLAIIDVQSKIVKMQKVKRSERIYGIGINRFYARVLCQVGLLSSFKLDGMLTIYQGV